MRSRGDGDEDGRHEMSNAHRGGSNEEVAEECIGHHIGE